MSNLLICSDRLKIDSDEGLAHLKQTVLDNRIEFLILDPFYTLHGMDENSASDMSTVLSNLKALLHDANIGCLLIHHEGKYFEGKSTNVNHRGRGSSAIGDVPDGHLYLKRDIGNQHQFDLDGNFRNYKPLSLRLELTENMKFTDSKSVMLPKLSPEDIVLKILGTEPLFKKALLKKASSESNFSRSAIEKAILKLIEINSLVSVKIGKEAFYSLKEHHQYNTSLRRKNIDDVDAMSLDQESGL